MLSWIFARYISPELFEILAIPIFMILAFKALMWVVVGFRLDQEL